MIFWAYVGDVRTITDNETLRLGKLAQLSKTLLVLPHSNAGPERLFSLARKIHTELRREMHMDPTTLSDSLSVTLNNDTPCYVNEGLLILYYNFHNVIMYAYSVLQFFKMSCKKEQSVLHRYIFKKVGKY